MEASGIRFRHQGAEPVDRQGVDSFDDDHALSCSWGSVDHGGDQGWVRVSTEEPFKTSLTQEHWFRRGKAQIFHGIATDRFCSETAFGKIWPLLRVTIGHVDEFVIVASAISIRSEKRVVALEGSAEVEHFDLGEDQDADTVDESSGSIFVEPRSAQALGPSAHPPHRPC